MKKIIISLIALILCVVGLRAQNCKPDYSGTDKITGQTVVNWEQRIYESSFGTRLISTSTVYIHLSIGVYGNVHALNMIVKKSEESKTSATFESQFKGAVGNIFFLGTTKGIPLTFKATQVSNETKIDKLLGTGLWTTVVLSAHLTQEQVDKLQKDLENNTINAFRVNLENNVLIEESIKDRLGSKLSDNFNCYFDYLKSNNVEFASGGRKMTKEEMDKADLGLERNAETGKYQFAKVYDVPNTDGLTIYKRIKLNWIDQSVIKYITADIEPDRISLNYPFQAGDGLFGRATQTFDIKDNKFRYSIVDIEYSNDGSNWYKPEESGYVDVLKWVGSNISLFEGDLQSTVINYKSDW